MKELHNHIFSNTTCISKETMLKYINKQLSKKELYEVEKHMLDCELCSDAYAGMQYAQNSSMLFAIDNQIDKRVGVDRAKTPIIRSLMVAASVLIILFGAYFSVDYFNKTIGNDSELAINETNKSHENEFIEEEFMSVESIKKSVEENKSKAEDAVVINAPLVEPEELIVTTINSESTYGYVNNEVIEVVSFDEEEDIEIIEVEAVVIESADAIISENRIEDDESQLLQDSPRMSSDAAGVVSSMSNMEPLKKSEKSVTRSKSPDKRKRKTTAEQPMMNKDVPTYELTKYKDGEQIKMLVIDGYKVFDYKEEYQAMYDAETDNAFELKSVSAGFESKADMDVVEKELESTIIEITYKETLENAIRFYKNKEYRDAISEFDNILAKHPKEVNAQFYSGLCFYHLGQNAAAIKKFDAVLKNKQKEFSEEANWYKALTLIKMKNTTIAKKLLRSIVKKGGFYKVKAEEKLEEL